MDETNRNRQGAWRLEPFSRAWATLLVAVAVGFNLVVLRKEVTYAQTSNDSDLHLAMVRWARHRIQTGHIPLDGWFPNFGLGSAQFHHYQSFPHIVAGYIATIFGAQRTFLWTLYILLALWPICVYISGRIFGAERSIAAFAAVVSPLIVSLTEIGYEHGAYTSRGFGTWAQLWGMWLLPLALALAFRALTKGKGYVWAALTLALLLATHFLTGYLAVLTIGLWVIMHREGFVRRLGRAIVVLVGAAFVAAWALIPLLIDGKYIAGNESLIGTVQADSYGLRKVVLDLFAGRLFDFGRPPILTILVIFGFIICLVRRRDDRARALLIFGVLSLVLYIGRPTFGPLFRLLPGSGEVYYQRFILGVHLAGLGFAGVAIARLGELLRGRLAAWAPDLPLVLPTAVMLIAVLAVLLPAWHERWTFDRGGAELIDAQRSVDETTGVGVRSLIAKAVSFGDGRVYGGLRSNWGSSNRIGGAPLYSMLAAQDADAIGLTFRTNSLGSGAEAQFNDTQPAQYDLFNVRYLILPVSRKPSVPATRIEGRSGEVLWRVDTSGYLEVVDTAGVIVADRSDLGRSSNVFLRSDLVAEHRLPVVAYGGSPPPDQTLTDPAVTSSPGDVTEQIASPQDGVFAGHVTATRTAAVLLKSSYDPRWRVLVDGRAQKPEMVAPGFVAATVPAGMHTVEFIYVPFPGYGWLLAIGILALAALAFAPRFFARRGSVASSGT